MIAKLLLTVAALVVSSIAFAKEAALTSNQQKASYVLGLQTVLRLRSQEIRIDSEAFLSGIGDALANHDPKLSKDEIVAAYAWQLDELNKRRTAKAERALTASQTFLKQNRGKEGIEQLASGLQYQVLAEGAGARPKATDKVKVRYRGTFTNGREFDNSERRRNAGVLAIPELIKGLQEALQLMSVGSEWRICIPPNLAHGTHGSPDGKIGPNEALVYEVALLSIVKSDEQKPSESRPTAIQSWEEKRGKAMSAQ